MLVKLCGLRRCEPLEPLRALTLPRFVPTYDHTKADTVSIKLLFGINCVPQSSRYVPPEQRPLLCAALKARFADADVYAVTANAAVAELTLLLHAGFDGVQLHGTEVASDYLAAIRIWRSRGARVIKAISAQTLGTVETWEETPDLFIIDTPKRDLQPRDQQQRDQQQRDYQQPYALHGGSGQTFPWKQLGDKAESLPKAWLLAGGLCGENVASAYQQVAKLPGFAGFDVASGIEHNHNIDPERVVSFIQAITKIAIPT